MEIIVNKNRLLANTIYRNIVTITPCIIMKNISIAIQITTVDQSYIIIPICHFQQVDKYTTQKLLSHLWNSRKHNEKIAFREQMTGDQESEKDRKFRRELPKTTPKTLDVFACIKSNQDWRHNRRHTFSVSEWQSEMTKSNIASMSNRSNRCINSETGSAASKLRPLTANSSKVVRESFSRPKSAPSSITLKGTKFGQNIPTSPENENYFRKTKYKYIESNVKDQEGVSSQSSSEFSGNDAAKSEATFQTDINPVHSETENDEKEIGDEINTHFSRLRHWKRDLLREAPRGLFSNRKQVKVNIVMSKAKRAHELDRMVMQHVYDPKEIAKKESKRREYNKLHLYTTLMLLQDDALKEHFSK